MEGGKILLLTFTTDIIFIHKAQIVDKLKQYNCSLIELLRQRTLWCGHGNIAIIF